jgi:WXXGXW repeat (2 copies)
MKKFLFASVFAAALMIPAADAADVFVRVGPPRPPREVVVARPGPGYVWTPGYYRWAGARYVWAPGYWALPPRPHAVWVPGNWRPRHGGYVWVGGYWR